MTRKPLFCITRRIFIRFRWMAAALFPTEQVLKHCGRDFENEKGDTEESYRESSAHFAGGQPGSRNAGLLLRAWACTACPRLFLPSGYPEFFCFLQAVTYPRPRHGLFRHFRAGKAFLPFLKLVQAGTAVLDKESSRA